MGAVLPTVVGVAGVGYSATPQARKLGLRTGQRFALDDPPDGWFLDDPPPGMVTVADDDTADLIVAFFTVAAALSDRLPALGRRIFPAGMLWVAWPRRAGGHTSDITDNTVREHALRLGLVDTKIAAIDADWSGLRLVWRRSNR